MPAPDAAPPQGADVHEDRLTDYDRAADAYARHRRADEEMLRALERAVPAGGRVLEVGCGSGNYLRALRERTGAECVGVEPSAGMRALASDLDVCEGSAEALPFPDASFDLAYAVDVIHHVADRPAAVGELARVLRPEGRLCIATDDEDSIRARLHSRYFAEVVEPELRRYPPLAELENWLAAAGFAEIRVERVESPYVVTDAAAFRERAFSSLELISEAAFGRGLERLERDLANGPVTGISRHVLVWSRRLTDASVG